MSYLLDTDICSAYLKNDRLVVSRVTQHFGSLHLSTITVGELLTWACRANAPPSRIQGIRDLMRAATVLDITVPVAETFGTIRAGLFDRGLSVGEMDLLIGAAALVHGLTVVTHNTKDYANIPGLTLADWLIP